MHREYEHNLAYDSFRHLAAALFWKSDDLIVVASVAEQEHTAYFDESGSRQSEKFVVVGGYVGNLDRWTEFTKSWREALDRAGVEYFHAKEFFPSAGQFKKWKHKKAEHDDFNRNLVKLQTDSVACAFLVIIPMSVWTEVNRRYQLEESGLFPYPLCGRGCVRLVRNWCKKHDFPQHRTKFIFESGSRDWGHLTTWIEKGFGFKPQPGVKKEDLPLQAADYLAWHGLQLCRRLNRVDSLIAINESVDAVLKMPMNGGRKALRKDFNALIKGVEHEVFIWSKEELLDLCQSEKLSLRSRGRRLNSLL